MAAPSKRKPSTDPHRSLRAVTVANPFYSRAHDGDATNPRTIQAVVNIKESAAVMLYSRGRQDDAQFAGSRAISTGSGNPRIYRG